MDKNKPTKIRQSLAYFKTYLLYVRKISKATADDYCKRIKKICRDEKLTYSELNTQIEKIACIYTEGEKKEIGNMSHNSYSNALKQYLAFVKYSEDIVVEWDHTIKLGKTKSGMPNVSIYDEKNSETISSVSLNHYGGKDFDEFGYELVSTMVQLCLPIIHKNNPNAILDFLEENGFNISFNN